LVSVSVWYPLTYVRDDRPFAGTAAPAAAFFYSSDRGGVHPDAHLATFAGLMQADAYAGFNRLYAAGRQPGADHGGRVLVPLSGVRFYPVYPAACADLQGQFATCNST
jgi:Transposase IS66 family